MEQSLEDRYSELKARVHILEEENISLSESAEEILLIKQVAEEISFEEDANHLLESVLERISILKDISHSFCYELSGDSLVQIGIYSQFDEMTLGGETLKLTSEQRNILFDSENLFSGESPQARLFINHLPKIDCSACHLAILPFKSQLITQGLLLFVDMSHTPNRLSLMIPLLQHITTMVTEKLDKISLQNKLKRMNDELEDRVEQRTKELINLNSELTAYRDHLEELVEDRTKKISESVDLLQYEINERKAVEKSLRENEKRLQTVISSVPIVLWAIDQNGFFTLSEGEGLKTLGLKPGQVVGQSVFEIYQGNTDILKNINLALDGKTVAGITLVGDIAFESWYSPLRDDLNNVIGVIGVSADITEQKSAEDKLRLFKNLINQSSDAIFVTDSETGQFLDFNEKACAGLGYSREEMLKLTVRDIETIIPDDISWKKHIEDMRKHGTSLMEGQHKRKDGSIFPVEAHIRHIQQKGQSYIIAVARDITDRKLVEEELRVYREELEELVANRTKELKQTVNQLEDEITKRMITEEILRLSEEKYRNLFENANDAIYIVESKTLKILHCNRKATEMVNYSLTELKNMTIKDLYPKDKWDILSDKVNEIKQTGSITALTGMFHKRKDGTLIPIEISSTTMELEERQVFMTIVRDVSERVKAEEKLKRAQEIMFNQEKRAVVGSLMAGLVHEVKNLLNPIGLLEFLYGSLPDKEREYINIIFHNRDRIISLIDEVRALAKNEITNYPIKSEDLSEIIYESVHLTNMDADVTVTNIDIDNRLTDHVLINKDKILQVLLNLIRNASHASELREEPKIIISTEKVGDFALIQVSDNGIGIDDRQLQKIWEPFFTTKGDKGTGIGLDICKRIVEGHNGEINCTSKIGEGSTFSFSLPLTHQQVANAG